MQKYMKVYAKKGYNLERKMKKLRNDERKKKTPIYPNSGPVYIEML